MTDQAKDIIHGKKVTEKNYPNGKCVSSNTKFLRAVFHPSKNTIIVNTPMNATYGTNHAIQAAKNAFKGWRSTLLQSLVRYSFGIQDMFKENFEGLSKILAIDKAGGEYRRAFENFEIDAPIFFLKK